MSLPVYTPSYNIKTELTKRFVAVIADATLTNGCKLPSAFATDKVIGITQDMAKGASSTKPMPIAVARQGRTWLKMLASSTGSAGDYIKLGANTGYGTLADPEDDAGIIFARALSDWESGSAGNECEVDVELMLQVLS